METPKYDTLAVEQHWQQQGHSIDTALLPFPEHPTAQQYLNALKVREAFANLFLGDEPFFKRPTNKFALEQRRNVIEAYCHEILEQNRSYRIDMHDRGIEGIKHNRWQAAIVGAARAQRPFAELLDDLQVVSQVYKYVEEEAQSMANACRLTPGSSSAGIWLGYKAWWTLNPYGQARVVLAIRAYRVSITRRYINGLLAEPATQEDFHLNSVGHTHAPLLTSRQARRSAMMERELQARWA